MKSLKDIQAKPPEPELASAEEVEGLRKYVRAMAGRIKAQRDAGIPISNEAQRLMAELHGWVLLAARWSGPDVRAVRQAFESVRQLDEATKPK